MTAQQLRNSILQQAIQGRLVPQDPNDEPASVLLERIRKEKEQLVKEGKLKKKDLVVEPVSEEEKPFEIPETWEWVRLGEIAAYRKGPFGSSLTKSMFVPKSDSSFKVYEQKNAIQKNAFLGDYYISKEKFESMKSFLVSPGDIIVSCAGTIGETYLVPEDSPVGIINQALMRVKLYDQDLVSFWMLFFEYVVISNSTLKGNGSAIKNIPPFEILKNLPIPLPPLAEQRRIVAKIEELMPLVEKYGKAQTELDTLNQDLPRRLRQSVLQQAIQGKLVEQDPNDEPIEVILRNFDKKIEYSIDEETPSGWCKISMGQITDFINGLAFKPEDWEEQGLPIVRIQNLSNPYAPCHKTTKVFDGEFKICKGDLLFSWSATLDSFIWEGGDAYLNQHIFKLIPKFFVDKYFLYYLLKAIVNEYKEVTHGSTMKHITKGVFENKIVLLPPLAEQRRIVAKIEELFAEIDKLK